MEFVVEVVGVILVRIVKIFLFKIGDDVILIVIVGDVKIDNKKYKVEFNCKVKMLILEEVLEFIGYVIGGVCLFGLKNFIKVYLDDLMKRFDIVFFVCGSSNFVIEFICEEMEKFFKCEKWVDVCKNW